MTVSDVDELDGRIVKALGHPLRLRILEIFVERGETTPIAVARELARPISTISRHVRLLRDLEFLELTRTEPRRGTVAHFYRPTTMALIDEEAWDQLTLSMRRGLVAQTFRKVFREAAGAGGAGGFDGKESRLQRVPLALDERGWRELAGAVDALISEAEEIQGRSDARRGAAGRGAPAPSSVLDVLHFAVPPETVKTHDGPVAGG